jgi:hypothetical protein
VREDRDDGVELPVREREGVSIGLDEPRIPGKCTAKSRMLGKTSAEV